MGAADRKAKRERVLLIPAGKVSRGKKSQHGTCSPGKQRKRAGSSADEEEAHPLGGGEGQKPGGNIRVGWTPPAHEDIKDMPNRLVNSLDLTVGDADRMEWFRR